MDYQRNLTAGMVKTGAQLDITHILQAIATSGVNYGSVVVQGTFPLVDKFGNAENTVVIQQCTHGQLSSESIGTTFSLTMYTILLT